jgi:hypothetical protein
MAAKLGGLVFSPEHRYYGQSLPLGNGDANWLPQNVQFLTVQQAVADYAGVLKNIKAQYGLSSESFVTSVGGSCRSCERSRCEAQFVVACYFKCARTHADYYAVRVIVL